MKLRIGMDAWPLAGTPTGIGRYVRELWVALAASMTDAEFVLYAPRPIDVPPGPRWTTRVVPPGVGRLPGYAWLKWRVSRACAKDRLDVFWATRTLAPGLPAATALVTTVYDLNYRIVPDTMQAVNRWSHRLWFARDVRRADAVVAISRGTSERLREWVGRAADAVAVPAVSGLYRAPPQHAVDACLERHGIVGPYLLSVATREPRKNLHALVEAHASLHARGLVTHALVLVGADGWSGPLRSSAPVKALGYVPEADLPALYAGAAAFVLPSRYEGYGIPALEARACGTRVVATDLPELREAGGPDATYVPPDAGALADGIMRVLQLPPPPLRAETLPTWEGSARVLEDVLRAAAR